MYTTGVPVLRLCNVTQHSSVNTYKHCTSVTFNLFLLHGHPKLRHGPGCRFEMLVIDFDDKEAENVFFFHPAYLSSCKENMFICTYNSSVPTVQFMHSIQVRNIFDFTVFIFGVA